MLVKRPKPSIRKWFKKAAIVLFVGEGLLFAASYGFWYGINTERSYRKYLQENYPSALELYYTIGETIDSNNKIRQIDYAHWQAAGKN